MSESVPARKAEHIYLSDVEVHQEFERHVHPADLRARILFHVLFSDVLLIGDSQSLNTPEFRALLSSTGAPGEDVRADIEALLKNGHVRVARREGMSLRAIRDEHAARNVENVPSAAYAEGLDLITARHAVTYDRASVERAFKAGVLHRLEGTLARTDGRVRAILEAAHTWVEGQSVLFYKAIRDWEEEQRYAPGGSGHDVELAVREVERAAGDAYRQALPGALGAGTARPRTGADGWEPAERQWLRRQSGLPDVFDAFLLGRLPLEVLLEVIGLECRRVAVRELAEVRRGRQPDEVALCAALVELASLMQEAFARAFRTDEQALSVLRAQTNRMRLGVVEDPSSGGFGAVLEPEHPGPDLDQFSLEVRALSAAPPATGGSAARAASRSSALERAHG